MTVKSDIAGAMDALAYALPNLSDADLKVLSRRALKEHIDLSSETEMQTFVAGSMQEVREYWAQDFDAVRTKRGISREVWEARPYMRWPDPSTQGDSEVSLPDVSVVAGAYWGLDKYQRAFMTRLAKQSPGWVIVRHAVPGFDHVYAEIRPDSKVETGPPIRHWHGSSDEVPENAHDPGVSVLDHGSEAWEEHCRRVNEDDDEPYSDHEHEESVHEHPDAAKYVFAPSPKRDEPWTHDHHADRSGRYYKEHPEALQRHIQDWHEEHPESVEWHVYGGMHTHTRRVKDYSNSLARRIDIHPMALPLLDQAEVVYFVIEGCLKADSILSVILREGRNESVISVPSVSLWHADELELFAERHLRSKTVVVVPDADWIKNDKIIAHARAAEYFLRKRCHTRAYVAAPPLRSDRTVEHKGVDDYLGEGGKLEDLMVMERTVSPMIAEVERRQGWLGYRSDRVRNDVQAIEALAHLANKAGVVQTTLTSLRKILDCNRQTAFNIIGRLAEAKLVRLEGEFATLKGYHTKEGYFPSVLEWKKSKLEGKKKENPRIYIAEELCGEDDEWSLGELRSKIR
jgi:hypothetical protein